MLYVVCIVGYMMIGFLITWTARYVHLLRAERKGYNAIEWWEEYVFPIYEALNYKTIRLIFGLIIWPIRFISFIVSIPRLYSEYDIKLWKQCEDLYQEIES